MRPSRCSSVRVVVVAVRVDVCSSSPRCSGKGINPLSHPTTLLNPSVTPTIVLPQNHFHWKTTNIQTCGFLQNVLRNFFSWHFFGDHVVCSVISRWKLLDFSVIVLGFLGDFTLFNALLRGSNGLSARRVQRTKSRRPQGPKAGLRGRQLVFYNTASHQTGGGGSLR